MCPYIYIYIERERERVVINVELFLKTELETKSGPLDLVFLMRCAAAKFSSSSLVAHVTSLYRFITSFCTSNTSTHTSFQQFITLFNVFIEPY